MAGRPRFKPTKPQRDRVKLLKAAGWSNERIASHLEISRNTLEAAFVMEIQFGADAKQAQILANLEAASKKGNASASKQLLDRFDLARANEQLASRRNEPEEPEAKLQKQGKKELQQEAAEQVEGKFAPPSPPKLH